MTAMRTMRTVIEEPWYEKQLAQLIPDRRVADHILNGVIATIAYEPEVGRATREPSVRAVPVTRTPLSPPMVLYYRWDENTVWLIGVRAADVDDEVEDILAEWA